MGKQVSTVGVLSGVLTPSLSDPEFRWRCMGKQVSTVGVLSGVLPPSLSDPEFR